MKNTFLQALQRCYSASDALVLLLDENWTVLWTNRECSDLPPLPSVLGVQPDHIGNAVQMRGCCKCNSLFTYDTSTSSI